MRRSSTTSRRPIASRTPGNRHCQSPWASRPPADLQPLEARVLLSTMVVSNTNDSGPGSLRQAILDANAALDAAVIRFEVPAGDPGFIDVDAALPGGDGTPDVLRIAPLSVLPTITNTAGVTIDGRSQTQFGGDTNPFGPEIVIDGALLPADTDGLTFHSSGNVVSGLNLHSFPRDAVVITLGGSNVLQGNYIGIDPTGRLARRNRLGVYIVGSAGNLIGGTGAGEGNVISGNLLQGIQIRDAGSTANVVQGNRIGTNALGTAAVGNQDGIGIYYGASDNLVGGATEAARNLISGNSANGVILAGTTALGFALRNRIEGNFIGTNAAGTAGISPSQNGINVILGSHDTVIRGTDAARQVISGNNVGINVFLSDRAVIEGNFVGTDLTGMSAVKNNSRGIIIQDSNDARIGGGTAATRNVISGNSSHGISIQNVQGPTTTNNTVRGNYIGTDVLGTGRIANGQNGIAISATGNAIGGPLPGQGNVISGNKETGILLTVGGSDTIIQGNLIGVDVTGTLDLGNDIDGIEVRGASGTIIGGNRSVVGAGVGNIISGSGRHGIHLTGTTTSIPTTNTRVQGNFIGTNAVGDIAVGNAGSGVYVLNARDNLIGGLAAGDGNVISGNLATGVSLLTTNSNGISYSQNNEVQGNFIGVDAAGTGALGNGREGVLISAAGSVIGATTGQSAGGNVIAFNGMSGTFAGVAVVMPAGGPAPIGNVIRANSIHDNTGLGIDLSSTASANGITSNDGGDVDAGANMLINFPVIAAVTPGVTSGTARVSGAMNGVPGATYALDFYANPAADPTGHGEGRRYLGTATVILSATGSAAFDVQLAGAALNQGDVVAATATRDGEGTSEFSNAVGAQSLPALLVTDVVQSEGDGGTTQFSFVVSLSSDPSSSVSVNIATIDGTATSGDFQAAGQVLTFNPGGPLTQSFVVNVAGETMYEAGEVFTVQMSGAAGATIAGTGAASGLITNDDAPPLISVADASVGEAHGSFTSMVFVFTLSQASGLPATVILNTTNGTASNNDRSSTINVSFTIDPGQVSKNYVVSITGDRFYEPAETFFLNLSGPQGVIIADDQAVGTILESDAIPLIDAVTVSPMVASPSELITLTAVNVRDDDGGTVNRVEFYRDWNGDGVLQVGVDLLMGTDTDGSNGWSTALGQGSQPLGTHLYLARARDDGNDWSLVVASGSVVVKSLFAPTDITRSSNPVVEILPPGQNAATFATADPDGTQEQFTYSLVPGPGADDNHAFNFVGSQLHTTRVFDFETKSTYSIRVRSTDSGGQFIEKVFTGNIVNTAEDTTSPRVTTVFVGGSWTSAFYSHLAAAQLGGTFGVAVPTGPSQLSPLPWFTSTIAVRFNEYVDVRKSDLSILGVSTADYAALLAAGTFSFDAATFTARWTLSTALPADKLRVILDDRIADTSGNALDGEWIDGVSTQSGNGSAGGDLSLRINLLPGDVNRDGSVTAADLALVRAAQFKAAGAAGYQAAYDLNGSAAVLMNDAVAVRNLQGTTLSAGEPAAALPAAAPSSTQVTPFVVRSPRQLVPLHLAIPTSARIAPASLTIALLPPIHAPGPYALTATWSPLVPVYRFAISSRIPR